VCDSYVKWFSAKAERLGVERETCKTTDFFSVISTSQDETDVHGHVHEKVQEHEFLPDFCFKIFTPSFQTTPAKISTEIR